MALSRPACSVPIRNIAHRGLWNALVPQNTVEAFRRAWESGATWCETDFHHTRAGQMICLHAEGELRRYTGCEKAIADLTPDEVATLRLDPARFAASYGAASSPTSSANAADFRIPLLDEVLATVPPHGTLQAEIKGYSPEYADLFDAAVREAASPRRTSSSRRSSSTRWPTSTPASHRTARSGSLPCRRTAMAMSPK